MSDSFRFHAPTGIDTDKSVRRLRKQRMRSAVDPVPLGADTGSITDARGQWPIEVYADLAGTSYITLTRKEADLIALANPGIRPPLALEKLHPWLPKQNYQENSARNFQTLQLLLRRFGRSLMTPAAFCDEKWKKVCNSVRMTTDLDIRFYSAWHLPLQDAYVLEERGHDRRVVALDFNAMYPFCMQQQFPKPSKMRTVVYDRDITHEDSLPIGLFRCTLHSPCSDFIRRYNPFRIFFAGRHLQAALTGMLTVDLNEFEVAYFQQHFTRIYVADAVVSDQCISHPLARDAKRSYARRTHYLAQNNKALADREKFLSTLLASCTQRPGRSRELFASAAQAEYYLTRNFGIVSGADDPARLSAAWLLGRKGLMVSETADGVFCDTPELSDGRACFVFNQRIVARSRIMLLKMMEKISKTAPDVEICYTNIDSIHFSLPSDHLEPVLNALRPGASDRMGDFRIEAVTRSGLWLEPGRYWLYSDDVVKFRNRSIGIRSDAFADHSIHVVNRKIGDLHVPIRMTIGMDRSMSDTRSIFDDPVSGIAQQHLVEVGDGISASDVLSALERNRTQCVPRRMQAFRRLAKQIKAVRSRCLET